jgi:hypothetical protein
VTEPSSREPLAFWMDKFDLPVDVVAAATAVRLENELDWVNRRTERFEFLDSRRLRKTIQIELTVPESFGQSNDLPIPILPIARPRKRFLRNVRLTDEAGAMVPWLTRDANALVSTRMLIVQARQLLENDEELPEAVEFDFADIAGLRHDRDDTANEPERLRRQTEALSAFRRAHASKATAGDDAIRCRLWDDDVMRSQTLGLTGRFLLLVPDLGVPGTRRIITLTYEWSLGLTSDATDSRRQRAWAAAKWVIAEGGIGNVVEIPTRGPFSAGSYHAEVFAPEDVTIVGARLQEITETNEEPPKVIRTELSSDQGTLLAHLFANGRRPPPQAPGGDAVRLTGALIRIRLRLRAGLVLPVVLTSASVAAVLTGGLVARGVGAHPKNDTIVGVLLALPALYAAYALPQGHPFMRRMFLPFRSMLVVLAALPYAAAATLAVPLDTTSRYIAWSLLDLVALGCLQASWRALRQALHVTFDKSASANG